MVVILTLGMNVKSFEASSKYLMITLHNTYYYAIVNECSAFRPKDELAGFAFLC